MEPCRCDVTIVTPHIPTPERSRQLTTALASATAQTQPPCDVIVAVDVHHEGAAVTRNRALAKADTHWVAFLDDDDELDSTHLATLLDAAARTSADVVYSGCRVVDRNGWLVPLREEWGRFGQQFDGDLLRRKAYLPVTSLVRTTVAQAAKFGAPLGSLYDDWGFYLRALNLGARFHHEPQVTWTWNHHGANTSGQGDRW